MPPRPAFDLDAGDDRKRFQPRARFHRDDERQRSVPPALSETSAFARQLANRSKSETRAVPSLLRATLNLSPDTPMRGGLDVGQGRMHLPDVRSFKYGATASAFYAGVRIAADRHKDPLGRRVRGVDEERQAARALL